ncbi:Dolichyl-diphosphooligosaccharide--protein glycosyltransferase subunit stt3b [Goodea atripinnis]|uniref:dolichyl-diphosphooligosaccharide--protein glycotransferase n=1 Tax=Goodea atripinnis TaxID=208336 RepID=A0ABV0MQL6_9TELE
MVKCLATKTGPVGLVFYSLFSLGPLSCPQRTAVYPGLMVTAGLIHYVLNLLHITVHIRDVCVFLAPVFSGLTAISTFLLTRELWNQGAGLLAACFIAIVPGYISRSVAGSFDNEGIAIFALQFTYYLWVCALNSLSQWKIDDVLLKRQYIEYLNMFL